MIRGSKIGILTRTRRRVACRCGKAVGVRGWRREQLVNADDPNFQFNLPCMIHFSRSTLPPLY